LPVNDKESLLAAFATALAARHAVAEATAAPSLIQEHATLEHVMVAGNRLVTFDLEVAYARGSPRTLATREILACLGSLFKRLPTMEADRFLTCLAAAYADRSRLEFAAREYLSSPSPWRRLGHLLADARARSRGRTPTRRDLARRLQTAMDRWPQNSRGGA
jgi:hypothetical protein